METRIQTRETVAKKHQQPVKSIPTPLFFSFFLFCLIFFSALPQLASLLLGINAPNNRMREKTFDLKYLPWPNNISQTSFSEKPCSTVVRSNHPGLTTLGWLSCAPCEGWRKRGNVLVESLFRKEGDLQYGSYD